MFNVFIPVVNNLYIHCFLLNYVRKRFLLLFLYMILILLLRMCQCLYYALSLYAVFWHLYRKGGRQSNESCCMANIDIRCYVIFREIFSKWTCKST